MNQSSESSIPIEVSSNPRYFKSHHKLLGFLEIDQRCFPLKNCTIRIGSAKPCAIRVFHDTVFPIHFILQECANNFLIVQGSPNSTTYLNGKPISSTAWRFVDNNAEIKFGSIKAIVKLFRGVKFAH